MTETQSEVPTNLSIQEVRQQLVSLYVVGSKTDAQALFNAAQGATPEGWANLERILDPVNKFVVIGDLPYVTATVQAEPDGGGLTPPDDPAWPGGAQTRPADAPAGESTTATGQVTASELVERARVANTKEELDEIESLADGRITVLNAVDTRRGELNL